MYSLPYAKIFKQAYELAKNNRFLWLFGLFLVWGVVISNALSFDFTNPKYAPQRQMIWEWVIQNIWQNKSVLVFVVLVIVTLVILFFKAKAGLIIAVKAILDKQQTSFVKAFKTAAFFYPRVLGLNLLTGAIMLFVGLVLGAPIYYLSSQGLDFRAGLLTFLAILIFVPVSIILGFINSLGSVSIVIHDLKIGEAFNQGLGLSLKFWPTLFVFMVYLVLISAVIFIASVGAAVLIALPFVILANLIYDNGGLAVSFLVGGTGGLLGLIVFLTLQSAVISFHQTAWILALQELVKPIKTKEEAVVAVPETAISD